MKPRDSASLSSMKEWISSFITRRSRETAIAPSPRDRGSSSIFTRGSRGPSRKTWRAWSNLAVAACLWAAAAARADGPSPVFGYTHLMPSPLTLPAGRLSYGTAFSFGVTDFLQIGTDVVRDAYGVLNANAKIGLVAREGFAAALTLGFEKFNFKDFS